MKRTSARAAIGYATDGEMLKLYGLIVLGLVLTWVTPVVTFGGHNPAFLVLGMVVALASLGAVLSGVVAIVYKILTDVRTGEERPDGESDVAEH